MLKWLMLAVYVLLIAYVVWRTIHCMSRVNGLKDHVWIRIAFAVVFIALCITLLLGGLLPYGPVRIALHKFSNYWLGFFIYCVFFILAMDVLVLLCRLICRLSGRKLSPSSTGYLLAGCVTAALAGGFTIYGLVHADRVYVRSYEIEVPKDAGEVKELNIALLADLHLGYSIGLEDMKEMVEKVNALEPDIVLVAGDIVDNEYEAMTDPDGIAALLATMESKYGTYAVYGNHDVAETLIGGFSITPASQAFRDPRVSDFMQKAGFTMLEDQVELIDDSFYVAGRLDGEKAGDGTNNRTPVEELMAEVDRTKPVILLSHEPDELEENAGAGVDVMVCGHTHAGQFFPLTVVQPFVWENYWGHLQVEQMHNFVTSGIGIYGPDVRVATDSEIMQIKVRFAG